ncbi:MAG: tetratricopeptide repeat protein [Anaerolineales bacterium]|nr:tetratricopeptide repeat protein [Anaerolineales bacterium]
MSSSHSSMLTEAIAAARSGDRSRARDLLSRLLRADSSNAEYWVWMSAVVESQREKIYCLESALRLDPTNRAALRGLVLLGKRTPQDAELASALRMPQRKFKQEIAAGKPGRVMARESAPDDDAPPAEPIEASGLMRVVSFIGVSVVTIGIIAAMAIYLPPVIRRMVPNRIAYATYTMTPSITTAPGTPTATPIPASTRVVRTPIATEFSSTPIALLISATSTPTLVAGATPHNEYEVYQIGINALIEGDYEAVIEAMDEVVNYNGNIPEPHYFKGEAYRLLGQNASAIRSYDAAIQIDNTFAPAYLGRGRVLLERGDDRAQSDLERAVSLDPTFAEAYIELGAFYANNQLWTRLQTTMLATLNAGVRAPIIYIRLSEAELNLGEYSAALEHALEGSADDPSLLAGYLAVGRAYVAVAIYDLDDTLFTAAIWPLQTYLTYQPEDHRGWAALSRAQHELGNYASGLQAAAIALDLNNRNAPAYLARGWINISLGDYADALQDFQSAQRYGQETFDLIYGLGMANFYLENYEDTLQYLNDALEIAGETRSLVIRERKSAEVYAARGLVYETNPDLLNDAIRAWEWVLELENARPETRALAQQHYDELTGAAPTRTPTYTPSPSPESITPTPPGMTPTPTVTQ